jgi:hypothetical protein
MTAFSASKNAIEKYFGEPLYVPRIFALKCTSFQTMDSKTQHQNRAALCLGYLRRQFLPFGQPISGD